VNSIQKYFEQRLRFSFLMALSALLFFSITYSTFTIHRANSKAESFLLDHTSRNGAASLLSQDLLALQKETRHFVESIDSTQDFSVLLQVWVDGQLVAAEGSSPRFDLFSSSISLRKQLASGEILFLSATIDHFHSILVSFLWLIGILSAALLFFFFTEKNLRNSIAKLTAQIGLLVGWLDRTTNNLPDSLDQAGEAPLKSKLLEVESIGHSVSRFMAEISKLQKELLALSLERGRAQVALQVAHDIRSPIAVLDLILKDMRGFSEEEKAILQSAIERIRSIADGLLLEARQAENLSSASMRQLAENPLREFEGDKAAPVELADLVEKIIQEKSIELSAAHPGIRFRTDIPRGLSVLASSEELGRILSNLINNSAAAIEAHGEISLSSNVENAGFVSLKLSDTGRGFPPEILAGVRSGKIYQGNGLGISHAQRRLSAWGGRLELSSTEGLGTDVELHFIAVPMN
jgi:signal transduction histidine kinase